MGSLAYTTSFRLLPPRPPTTLISTRSMSTQSDGSNVFKLSDLSPDIERQIERDVTELFGETLQLLQRELRGAQYSTPSDRATLLSQADTQRAQKAHQAQGRMTAFLNMVGKLTPWHLLAIQRRLAAQMHQANIEEKLANDDFWRLDNPIVAKIAEQWLQRLNHTMDQIDNEKPDEVDEVYNMLRKQTLNALRELYENVPARDRQKHRVEERNIIDEFLELGKGEPTGPLDINDLDEVEYAILNDYDVLDELGFIKKQQKPVESYQSDMIYNAPSWGCLFCGPYRHHFPLEPFNVPLLSRFINTSGAILGRKSTGLCRTHQRKVARTIKWARNLNLLSFKNSTPSINNPFKPADKLFQPIDISEFTTHRTRLQVYMDSITTKIDKRFTV